MIKEKMEKIYKNIEPGKIPWNIEDIPEILLCVVTSRTKKPCKLIEFGCGAGNYIIGFSKIGFNATGVDIAENAIDIARDSALKAGVACRLVSADVLGPLAEIKDKYDFAYDWELLHHIFPEDRERYVQNVHRLLIPNGNYLSVCFSEDDPQFGGSGKYRETPLGTVLYFSNETEIESLFIKYFEIDELKTIDVRGKCGSHKAIWALMRKKNG